MLYDKEREKLLISLSEFVSTARREISVSVPLDEDEPHRRVLKSSLLSRILSVEKPERTVFEFTADGYSFELISDIDKTDGENIFFIIETAGNPEKPSADTVKDARGIGYVSAYAYMCDRKFEKANLNLTYINPESGAKFDTHEVITKDKAEKFFNKCKEKVTKFALPEIERVTLRAPSMASLKFPFKDIREGQREFVRSTYRTIARGGRLFATAPTGTGKTVSVLYPALKAMGDGRCDKVFYLTPKTTTAVSAADCLKELCENGANLRAVIITAKEKICFASMVCKDGKNLCEALKCNRISEAVLELYKMQLSVVNNEKIRTLSLKYNICPYELSLAYSELCDVVICDFNYLFDPAVYIRRFFTEGGRFAILIDEAHNLADRAREMYSASLTEEELVSPALSSLLGEHSATKKLSRELSGRFFDTLYPFVKEDTVLDDAGNKIARTHVSEIPSALYPLFEELIGTVEDEIYRSFSAKDEDRDERLKFLRSYLYKIKKYYSVMSEFDGRYEMFIFFDNDRISTKLFCIDPSRDIGKRLDKCSSAVFFSATLSPLYYYKSVLGGDGSADTLEVDSPFDPARLSVSVMDKISTRYSEREDTVLGVLRVVAATISAKRGNYMIFTPSFEYAENLSKIWRAKYPKLRTLTQKRNMTKKEKDDFLAEFSKEDKSYLVAFCVMGGIYAEGIDLAGDKLIGAVIVGIGMPSLSYEREAISAYYDEKFEEGKQFAYIYPGMNRVLQAGGRVIRREDDKGVVVLIDDRFADPIYKKTVPKLWNGMKFISDAKELKTELDEFWKE